MFSLKLEQQDVYTLMALVPLVLQIGALAIAIWADAYFKPNRIRSLLYDLRQTLKGIGMEDMLIRHRASIAIDCARIDCDFYRMQNGDIDAINAFHGEFMLQYSWAEITAGMLEFRY